MLHLPHVPKCCQHPRSRRARHPPLKDPCSQFCSCKDGSSSTTSASTDQGSDERSLEDGAELSLFKQNLSWNEYSKGIFSNSVEVPVIEVESVTKISSMDSSKSRMPHATWNCGSYSTNRVSTHLSAGSSPNTADKSLFPAAGILESWLAPGNVVWAKTAYHEWWPAEVIEEKDILDCSHHTGHVLVQLYGNNEHAWLDPVRDLSQFDHCFEERSKNPLEAFQDALKQALRQHAHTSSEALSRRCSGEVKSSSQNGTCDAEDPSDSSRMKDNSIEEGRGKRKRKMKIHFDDLSFPEKPPRRVRRLRIMRYLGLIAPIGSPFSPSHDVSINNMLAHDELNSVVRKYRPLVTGGGHGCWFYGIGGPMSNSRVTGKILLSSVVFILLPYLKPGTVRGARERRKMEEDRTVGLH